MRLQRRIAKPTLRAMFDLFRSVLYEDTTKAIRVCHPSFLDFLGNAERYGEHWTNTGRLHQTMMEKCFTAMRTKRKFNLCALESSYLADSNVCTSIQCWSSYVRTSCSSHCARIVCCIGISTVVDAGQGYGTLAPAPPREMMEAMDSAFRCYASFMYERVP